MTEMEERAAAAAPHGRGVLPWYCLSVLLLLVVGWLVLVNNKDTFVQGCKVAHFPSSATSFFVRRKRT